MASVKSHLQMFEFFLIAMPVDAALPQLSDWPMVSSISCFIEKLFAVVSVSLIALPIHAAGCELPDGPRTSSVSYSVEKLMHLFYFCYFLY